jgi:hypothetical protein
LGSEAKISCASIKRTWLCKPQTWCDDLRDKHELLRSSFVLSLVRVVHELPDHYSLKPLLETLVHVVSQSTKGDALV